MTNDDDLTRRLAAILAEAGDALPEPPPGALARIRRRLSRRRRARLATALAAVATVLAATVTSVALRPEPDQVAAPGSLSMWALTPVERNAGLLECIAGQNRGTGPRVELRTFANDAYKEALAGALPDVYENWGGAGLAADVAAGRAAELTGAATGLFLPGVLAGGRVGGRQYGLPVTGTQPVVLFYHKRLFAEARLDPPRTYAELLTAVDTFRNRGTTPIALADGARWPTLMWLMYLTDRLGGAPVLDAIAARRPGAWQHPAVLEAARLTQQLARRGAFGTGAPTTGTATGMLVLGGAAMHLMGSWEYGNVLQTDPGFAAGDLGWVPFPTVAGGTGAAADLVGVPANYLSVDAASPYRDEAVRFVTRTLTDDRFLDGLLAAGEVPPIRALEPRLTGPHAGFARFVHGLAAAAPGFALVWDQALPGPAADRVLTEADRLVRLTTTPEQFAAAMAAP